MPPSMQFPRFVSSLLAYFQLLNLQLGEDLITDATFFKLIRRIMGG
jgi:hypothetical protein